ncbi:MAG: hypothetical protein NTY47_05210, partial [Candidatus Omnitrophica bacterium]|nr:hypothetical protein [Candidatus Omnitrophota bacterium]
MRLKAVIHANRRIIIVLIHPFLIIAAYVFSFMLRFDLSISEENARLIFKTLPYLIIIKLLIFSYFGLFAGLWRYANIDDIWRIVKASFFSTAAFILTIFLIRIHLEYPRSIFILDFILCTGLVTGVRFATRLLRERFRPAQNIAAKRVLVVGAGEAGVMVLRESRNNQEAGMNVVGFVDDDPAKRGRQIQGVKILGARQDIAVIVKENNIEEIVIAIPSARGEVIRNVISYCQIPNLKVKIVPGL